MKRRLLFLICAFCVFALLCACRRPAAEPTAAFVRADTSVTVRVPGAAAPAESARPADAVTASEAAAPEETVTEKTPTAAPYVEERVDSTGSYIDFTAYSRSAVFTELGYLSFDPDYFVGKTLKLSGEFLVSEDDYLGVTFYGCVVKDATACCMQGVDFVPAPGFEKMVASLSNGDPLTVEGVFETYTLGGYRLYRVGNARVY